MIRIRKKHIRIGNKFDCVEGVRPTQRQPWLSGEGFGVVSDSNSVEVDSSDRGFAWTAKSKPQPTSWQSLYELLARWCRRHILYTHAPQSCFLFLSATLGPLLTKHTHVSDTSAAWSWRRIRYTKTHIIKNLSLDNHVSSVQSSNLTWTYRSSSHTTRSTSRDLHGISWFHGRRPGGSAESVGNQAYQSCSGAHWVLWAHECSMAAAAEFSATTETHEFACQTSLWWLIHTLKYIYTQFCMTRPSSCTHTYVHICIHVYTDILEMYTSEKCVLYRHL